MSVVLTIQQRSFFLEQMELSRPKKKKRKKNTIGQNAKNNWLCPVSIDVSTAKANL